MTLTLINKEVGSRVKYLLWMVVYPIQNSDGRLKKRTLFLIAALALLLKGQHVKPTRLQELGFEFHAPTLKQALEEVLKNEDPIATS